MVSQQIKNLASVYSQHDGAQLIEKLSKKRLKSSSALAHMPRKAMQSYVTPAVLKKDQDACAHIVSMLQKEEASAAYKEQLQHES